MTRSFDSWDSLNERRNLAGNHKRGDFTNIDGKKYKYIYKVKDKDTFNFKIKGVPGLIENNKLTKKSAAIIIDVLNRNFNFVAAIGKLDQKFFKNNYFIYKIKRGREESVSIRFNRGYKNSEHIEELKQYGLDPNLTLISTEEIKLAKKSTKGIVLSSELEAAVANTEKAAAADKVDPNELKSKEDAEGTSGTAALKGESFKYTMRTNGVTYTFTFNEIGAMEAVPDDSKYVNAVVSIEKPSKIMWYADSANQEMTKNNISDLIVDTELVNSKDKSFFTKMFNDEAFRKNIMKEKESEKMASGTFDNENIKAVLYNRKGELVFADYSKVGSKIAGSSKEKEEDEGESEVDFQKRRQEAAERAMKA